jgi:hypothetical protein
MAQPDANDRALARKRAALTEPRVTAKPGIKRARLRRRVMGRKHGDAMKPPRGQSAFHGEISKWLQEVPQGTD